MTAVAVVYKVMLFDKIVGVTWFLRTRAGLCTRAGLVSQSAELWGNENDATSSR